MRKRNIFCAIEIIDNGPKFLIWTFGDEAHQFDARASFVHPQKSELDWLEKVLGWVVRQHARARAREKKARIRPGRSVYDLYALQKADKLARRIKEAESDA